MVIFDGNGCIKDIVGIVVLIIIIAIIGNIAKAVSKNHGGEKVSARAVGGAVGWNPICIIVPCHRVIGADNGLTGYGGGLLNKVSLLAHEGSDLFDARIFAPKESSDELFLSVWRSPQVKEQWRLKRKFEKWIAADASWGGARTRREI